MSITSDEFTGIARTTVERAQVTVRAEAAQVIVEAPTVLVAVF